MEGRRHDRTSRLPVWIGQDWREGNKTGLQDLLSGRDRTEKQETGQDCIPFWYGQDRTGGQEKGQECLTGQERTARQLIGQHFRTSLLDRTGLEDKRHNVTTGILVLT